MFIPSSRVWNEMKSEPSGFWPVPMNDGNEYVFLLQTTTHIIKALYRSSPIKLFISIATTELGDVLSTGLLIADDPTAPFVIANVHRHAEEQLALGHILRARRTPIIFFDELSRPVARAHCELDHDSCMSATSMMGTGVLYAGAWNSVLHAVLDEFQGFITPTLAISPRFSPRVLVVPLSLSEFSTIRIHAVGMNEVLDFKLEQVEEGYLLEQATWHLMEGLFAKHLFHSPQVRDGGSQRELTDVLGICDAGMCFIETKAIAVLSTDPNRSTERRSKNIRKQIDKGLDQLCGAMRNVAAELQLASKLGDVICVPEGIAGVRHGIVMVSELIPNLDWEEIGAQLLTRSLAANAMLHILDLQELRRLVAGSRDDPMQFMAFLVQRFDTLQQCRSAYIRTLLKGPVPP